MRYLYSILFLFFLTIFSLLGEDNLTLGIPSKADTIVDNSWFAIGYSNKVGGPVWVTYTLTRDEVESKIADRLSCFSIDPAVPKCIAPDMYDRCSYNRGHLVPAADMRYSEQAMKHTFLMSNVSPQVPKFNDGVWNRLEEKVRWFAIREKKIVVITGPIFEEPDLDVAMWMVTRVPLRKNPKTIAHGKIRVPDAFFKVVYDLTPPCKMIGFIIPNRPSDRALSDFAVTVDKVELKTGFNFFSKLSESTQDTLEDNFDLIEWGF